MSQNTIEEIAFKSGTIPKYVAIYDTKVYMLEDLIKSSIENDTLDFKSFFNSVSNIFSSLSESDILELWLSMNTEIINNSTLIFYLQTEIGNVFDIESFITHDLQSFRDTLSRQKRIFREKYETSQSEQNKLSKSIEHTEFVQTSQVVNVVFTEHIPLVVLFDNFVPTANIFFGYYSGLYKYLDTYTPTELDKYNLTDQFIIHRNSIDNTKSQIIVSLAKNSPVIELTILIDEQIDTIISELLESLSIIEFEYSIQTISTQGLIFYVGYTTDKYIFSDFIMNNSIVSSLFSLGEFTSIGGKISTSRIYGKKVAVNGTVSPRTLISSSSDFKYLNTLLSVNDNYIRLFITKSKSINDTIEFIDLFSRSLALYYEEYNKIYSIYSEILDSIKLPLPLKISKKRVFTIPQQKLATDLFIPNYSRVCPHIPITANKGDPLSIEFPINSGLFYKCSDPVYKYPGVRENILPNSDVYPYIPCCFKTDQSNKPKFIKYYGIKERTRTEQIRLITTLKVLNPSFFGILPKPIEDIFTSINLNKSFARYGVSHEKDSFIECLNVALSTNYSREDLLKINISLCMQENPSLTQREIEAQIRSRSVYLDPRKYIRLAERLFDVNIYVFDVHGVVIPNHVMGYYMSVPINRKCIAIYEHRENQVCELVAEWDVQNSEFEFVFSKRWTQVFTRLIDSSYIQWIGANKLYRYSIPEYVSDARGQYIDMYGKVRGLLLNINSHDVFIETSPIMPLNIPLAYRPTDQSEQINSLFTSKYGKYVNRTIDGVHTSFPLVNSYIEETGIQQYHTAQYLISVFLYMYSKWMHDTQNSSISEFVSQMVEIIDTWKYNISGPSVDDIDTVLNDGKFVVHSEQMIQRLLFVLRRNLIVNKLEVINYYKIKYIENFYSALYRFKRSRSFILTSSISNIVSSTETISKYIIPGEDNYVLDINGTLYKLSSIPDLLENSNTFVYNSPTDIVHIPGIGPSVLVYMHNGKRLFYRLEKYI